MTRRECERFTFDPKFSINSSHLKFASSEISSFFLRTTNKIPITQPFYTRDRSTRLENFLTFCPEIKIRESHLGQVSQAKIINTPSGATSDPTGSTNSARSRCFSNRCERIRNSTRRTEEGREVQDSWCDKIAQFSATKASQRFLLSQRLTATSDPIPLVGHKRRYHFLGHNDVLADIAGSFLTSPATRRARRINGRRSSSSSLHRRFTECYVKLH